MMIAHVNDTTYLKYTFVLVLGLLTVARVFAAAPPWEIWDDLHSLAEVRPAQRGLAQEQSVSFRLPVRPPF